MKFLFKYFHVYVHFDNCKVFIAFTHRVIVVSSSHYEQDLNFPLYPLCCPDEWLVSILTLAVNYSKCPYSFIGPRSVVFHSNYYYFYFFGNKSNPKCLPLLYNTV